MKLSNQPTAHLLVQADTNSEWDSCNFAIINITEEWKEQQRQRLQLVKPFQGDYSFQSLLYYDTGVDFFKRDEEDLPDTETWLTDRDLVYVELEDDELEKIPVPENRLECYRLLIRADGLAYFKAYGKHTSEEFWTNEFNLNAICAIPKNKPV